MTTWIGYFEAIESAAKVVLGNLRALNQRRAEGNTSPSDRQVLALFARGTNNDGRKNLEQSIEYLQKTLGNMILALSKSDVPNITTTAYQVGGFANYIYDVHGVEETPEVSSHPVFSGIRDLKAATRSLAAAYSPDYDASDKGIRIELMSRNPWASIK